MMSFNLVTPHRSLSAPLKPITGRRVAEEDGRGRLTVMARDTCALEHCESGVCLEPRVQLSPQSPRGVAWARRGAVASGVALFAASAPGSPRSRERHPISRPTNWLQIESNAEPSRIERRRKASLRLSSVRSLAFS